MSRETSLFDLIPSHGVRISDERRSLTGAELKVQATDVAEAILASGATRVALLGDNSVPWVVGDLACQLAGCAVLPIPPFFTLSQIEHALSQSDIQLVLICRESLATPGPVSNWLNLVFSPTGFNCGLQLMDRRVKSLHNEKLTGGLLPQGTGKITYTSGSTGTPKGVCLSNGQLIRQAQILAGTVVLEGKRHLSLLPLSVLLENVAGFYASVIAGGDVVLKSLDSLGFTGSTLGSISRLINGISETAPASLIVTPRLLDALVYAAFQGWTPPPALEFVAVGGSAVSTTALTAARKLGIPAYEGYGLSECASVVSLNTPESDSAGSAGKLLPGLSADIRDGELIISGNSFLGYVADPCSWYPQEVATGDIGHLDSDGFIHIMGRKTNLLVNSYGRNISPEWIESTLLADDLIAECIVFGDARPWLCALVLPTGDRGAVTDDAIQRTIERINDTLPDYARVQTWHRLDAPLATTPDLVTSTGKLRRDRIYHHFIDVIESLYPHQEQTEAAYR